MPCASVQLCMTRETVHYAGLSSRAPRRCVPVHLYRSCGHRGIPEPGTHRCQRYIPGISPFRVVVCTVLVLLRCSSFWFRNRTLPVHVSASQSFVVCVASCFGRRCVGPNCQRLCNNFKAVLDRQLLCLTQETTSRVARLFLSCWPRAAVHPRTLL